INGKTQFFGAHSKYLSRSALENSVVSCFLFLPQSFVFSVFQIQDQGDGGVQDYEQDDIELLVSDPQHFAHYLHDFYTDPEDCIHLGGQI
ncbi:MAG: hypothetical protein ACK5CH_14605, partial [Bacteroidota bacterium]